MKVCFVSGVPRSGSTLLMNILGQNKKFHVTPTSGLPLLLSPIRKSFTKNLEFKAQDKLEMKERYRSCVRGLIDGWCSPIKSNKKYKMFFDKSRAWTHLYPWMMKVYGEKDCPKIILTIRDIRGSLMSMEKKYRNDPETEVGDRMAHMNDVNSRCAEWMNSPMLGTPLKNLFDTIHTKTISKFLIIRFEDLTTQTSSVIKDIYKYVNEKMPLRTHNFKKVRQITKENDVFYQPFGDHKIRPDIKPLKNDYAEWIGQAMNEDIVKNNLWFYKSFYPEVLM